VHALLQRFARCRSGVAASEMVLVTPLLVILLFAALEAGNYLRLEHQLVQAVRAGARYGALHPDLWGTNCATTTAARTDVAHFTRTGSASPAATPRFPFTSSTPVSVTVNCAPTGYAGIYANEDDGAAYVTVEVGANQPLNYDPLFGFLPLNNLKLRATSQAAMAVGR
jgi:hypothetical protein